MLKKITSSIAGASIVLALVNLLTKGIGFLRDMYIASTYGLSEELDVYLVGAVIPLSITPIFLYIGQNYLIPQFDKLKLLEDKKEKVKIVSLNFFIFLGISVFVSILLFILSKVIIASYLNTSEEQINKATAIFNILLLTFPLSSITAFYLSYLQAKFEYRFTAVSFLYLNITMLVVLFFMQPYYGIYAIPVSFTLGNLFQVIYLYVKSRDLGRIELNHLFNKSNYGLLSKSTITNIIIIESIGQLFLISDRYFYQQVNTGGLAALSYGLNLVLLPVNIFAVALSSALFPQMTYNFNRQNKVELEKNVFDGLKINFFIMIPIAIAFYYYGDILVAFLFQRGKFSNSNTLMIFDIIKYLGLSIVFFSTYSIFNKLLYSSGHTKEILYITICAITVKIVANIILVKYLAQNGLALAYFLSYLVFFVLSYYAVSKKLGLNLAKLMLKLITTYSILGFLIGYAILKANYYLLFNKLLLPFVFMILYFGALYLFKDDNFNFIKRFAKTLKNKEKSNT